MSTFQKVIICGNLGQDPEVRYTQAGTAVANISLATTEKWKDKQGNKQENTEWHRCVAFGKTAELIGEYVHKGDKLLVEGTLQTRSWEDNNGVTKYTTEVKVTHMNFMGSANKDPQPERQQAKRARPAPPAPEPADDFGDLDVPF